MDFFTVSDKRYKDILYVQLGSFKASKKEQSTINYHLIIEDLDDNYKQYFKDLQDDRFHIIFYEARDYASKIRTPNNNYLFYIKCLAPSIFPNLDKILFLDTDVFAVTVGIEQLWETDISNKSIAGALNIPIQFEESASQLKNTRKIYNENYFDSGVLLMNLKRMRQTGIDKKLEEYLMEWPYNLYCSYMDQSLLNFVINGDEKIISTKWNNTILSTLTANQNIYRNYYETDNLLNKLQQAVVIHIVGPKPWLAYTPAEQYYVIFRKQAQEICGQIYKQLGKHETF